MLDLSLYLVTDSRLLNNRTLEYVVEQAVIGGVSIVQLREKEASAYEFYTQAIALKRLLGKYNVPLIINDRIDIAIACNADGVHIGQSDIPYNAVRQMVGHHKIIGLSVESMEDIVNANQIDVDYIALSPVFSTQTKTDIKQPFGEKAIKQAVETSRHKVIGIGGIGLDNIDKCAGLDGVAVVSAIISSSEPQRAARELRKQIEHYKR